MLNAYRLFLVMGATHAFATQLIYPLVAIYYVQTIGLNPLQLVLIGTVLELTIFLLEVPTGIFADSVSRRLSVIIGYSLIGLCFVLEGLIPLFVAILVAEIIRGAGETFISGALDAWLADEIGAERLGAAYLRSGQLRQIASLAGIAAGTLLATVSLNLPIVLGGVLLIGLAGFLVLTMHETGFTPTHEPRTPPTKVMLETLSAGVQAARVRPVVLTLLVVGLFGGASSEGLGRLWEAHLLSNVRFPGIGDLEPVVWFGVVNLGAALLNLLVAEVALRRLELTRPQQMARYLLLCSALTVGGTIVFGLSRDFALALAAFWLLSAVGTLAGPIARTWLNSALESRSRATVLSLVSQADALGQVVGGPFVGWVGTVRSLRAAMVLSAVLLLPALPLYAWAVRREGRLEETGDGE